MVMFVIRPNNFLQVCRKMLQPQGGTDEISVLEWVLGLYYTSLLARELSQWHLVNLSTCTA